MGRHQILDVQAPTHSAQHRPRPDRASSRNQPGLFALPYVLRDADVRDVPDLTAELHRVKREPSASRSGRLLEQAAPIATRIPGAVPAI